MPIIEDVGFVSTKADAGALATCLDRIEAEVTRYVWLPDHAPAVVSLWAAHTYCFDRFQYTPYLHITGPSRRCGKTRLLDFLQAVVLHPVHSEGVTSAALSRLMKFYPRATLLLDECDTLLKGNPRRTKEIRALLNMGFRRGGKCIKCAPGGADILELPAFGPKALARIGGFGTRWRIGPFGSRCPRSRAMSRSTNLTQNCSERTLRRCENISKACSGRAEASGTS